MSDDAELRCLRCHRVRVRALHASGVLLARLRRYDERFWEPSFPLRLSLSPARCMFMDPVTERLGFQSDEEMRYFVWPEEVQRLCQACRYEHWLSTPAMQSRADHEPIHLPGWAHVSPIGANGELDIFWSTKSELVLFLRHFRERQSEYDVRLEESKWMKARRGLTNWFAEIVDVNRVDDRGP